MKLLHSQISHDLAGIPIFEKTIYLSEIQYRVLGPSDGQERNPAACNCRMHQGGESLALQRRLVRPVVFWAICTVSLASSCPAQNIDHGIGPEPLKVHNACLTCTSICKSASNGFADAFPNLLGQDKTISFHHEQHMDPVADVAPYWLARQATFLIWTVIRWTVIRHEPSCDGSAGAQPASTPTTGHKPVRDRKPPRSDTARNDHKFGWQ